MELYNDLKFDKRFFMGGRGGLNKTFIPTKLDEVTEIQKNALNESNHSSVASKRFKTPISSPGKRSNNLSMWSTVERKMQSKDRE